MTADRERTASSTPDDPNQPFSGYEPGEPAVLVVTADGCTTGEETVNALRAAGFDVTRVAAEAEATAEFDCLVAVADTAAALDELESVHVASVPVVFVAAGDVDTADVWAAGADEFVAAANAGDPTVLDARVRGVVARATNSLLEADLARERSLLNAIFETVPAHLYVKDREGRHIRVSEAYVDDTERFLGKTDFEVFPAESSRDTYEDDMEIMATGEPLFDQEEPIVASDTHKFSLRHLLEEHGDFETTTGKWVLTSKVPWRDEDGEVVGLVGFTVDISEQKAYRQRLERQNERLEEFAGIVSHDLRSPLNVAQGYLELLESSVEDESGRENLERVKHAHQRMSNLIEDVLSLARQGTVVDTTEPTDLGDAARTSWQAAVEGTAPTLVVETGDLTIDADEGRLYELLANLFSNAVEHGSPPDETDSVTVRVGSLDDGFFVEDDGPGVPDEERESVFETGYTTHEEGTGFGLAIVRQIAEAHGWTVTLTESDAGGARFEFRTNTPSDGPFEDPNRLRASDSDAGHREGTGR